ncbi:MAG: hypothetical protein HYZ43_03290 [Flavobacteriia bacterium]|nr:hypothetical protein [Flavobacteriia bacterium]
MLDHSRSPDRERYASAYYQARRAKGVTIDEARRQLEDPLYFADLMVREGQADGSVSGATHTTAHTVSAALRCIGPRAGFKIVSSFLVMVVPNRDYGANGALIFADCGVVMNPSASELAEIAIASADSARAILETEPLVAMLSFSTKGSASHHRVAYIVQSP